jgi:predicted nucleic acid-binding protein
MSRIFWDTMLFIYLLDDHPEFATRTREILDRSYHRGDSLFTSYLVLGELMAGAAKSSNPQIPNEIMQVIREMGFSLLPFDEGAVAPFGVLRSKQKVKIADAIHLACASSAGIDLYLTGDAGLFKLDVPGIQFITNFNSSVL